MNTKRRDRVDADRTIGVSEMSQSRPDWYRDLREDARWAVEGMFSAAVGSRYLPRALRAALLRGGGARSRSAPGIGFQLVGSPRNLSIGPRCYFNQQVYAETVAPITIGADCAFGMQSMLVTSHHPVDEDGRWQGAVGRPIHIGDRVWIGARATILPGAVIEDDVIVAANAVVTGHCAGWGVYAGVPARRIRELKPSAAATSDR